MKKADWRRKVREMLLGDFALLLFLVKGRALCLAVGWTVECWCGSGKRSELDLTSLCREPLCCVENYQNTTVTQLL